MEWLKIVLISISTNSVWASKRNITLAILLFPTSFVSLAWMLTWFSLFFEIALKPRNLNLVSANFGFGYTDIVRMCCDISLRQVSALAIQTCFICSSSKLYQVNRWGASRFHHCLWEQHWFQYHYISMVESYKSVWNCVIIELASKSSGDICITNLHLKFHTFYYGACLHCNISPRWQIF